MDGSKHRRSRRGRAFVFVAGTLVGLAGAALVGLAPRPDGWQGAIAALVPAVAALGAMGSMLADRKRRRRREAELARLTWRLDFALAASQIGVWDADIDTNDLIWDARARAIFGVPWRPGFYSEHDWLGAIHPEDRERARVAADEAVATNGRFAIEYRVAHRDGTVRHVRDVAATYRGEEGAHRLVGLVWDVTSEVARRHELEERRVQAETATVAKSRFLAAMSHEIRTPLTGVLGMLDLVLEEPLGDRQRERVSVARSSAKGLLHILNDVLEFSKLEAGRIVATEQETDPRQLIREVADLLGADADRKGLTLRWLADDSVPQVVMTDPMRLRQILTNLLSNATKFTERGGIEVRAEFGPGPAGDELRIEVEDTGIGMEPAALARLFEEFYQADADHNRRRGGAGLGLAISKQLAEVLGGDISVSSAPGRGSVFRLRVPARPCAPSAPAEPKPVPPSPPAPAVPPMRVLLAEDTASNQLLIRARLEAAGHRVDCVSNGAEALRAVAETRYDVVLMDVQMPEMDGPSAARAIRALPGEAAVTPIVALTANALAGDREACIAAGMTDYVTKPIDFAELDRALLRAREAVERDEIPARRTQAG